MYRRVFGPLARARHAPWLVVAFVVLGVMVTEATYRSAKTTLASGVTLTDARISVAELLQSLTDLELATRLYVRSGSEEDAQWQRAIAQKVGILQQRAFEQVQHSGKFEAATLAEARRHIDAQVAIFESWRQLAISGARDEAVLMTAADIARQQREVMRVDFDAIMMRTAAAQGNTRLSLYDALMLNRLAIHGLMILAVLVTLLLGRSLRDADALRVQEQARLAALVDERTTALRELAGHLVTVREDERARLARELHDEMGGLLTSMKLELARLRRVAAMPQAANDRLQAIDKRLSEGIALKRRIIENLRPSSLDQLGLVAALELLCKDVADVNGVPVDTRLEPVRVSKDCELTIYRLVQESLTNVSKYSQCRSVTVSMRQADPQRVEVEIVDDGRGFDCASVVVGKHGLLGMRFRVESLGGKLTVRSAPGAGTMVMAEIPTPSTTSVDAAVMPA